MTIRGYRKDPRTKKERQGDTKVLQRFEQKEVLNVAQRAETEAARSLRKKTRERKARVAMLGREVGAFRRACGVSQAQVAAAIGTQKSNISRMESGRYGGLTLERFLATVDAIQSLAQTGGIEMMLLSHKLSPREWPVQQEALCRFKTLASCLEGTAP